AKAGQVLSNGTIVEGMGYAIPISYARPIIDELMNKSTKTKAAESNQSYLGIGGVDVTDEVATNYDIPEGIYVAQVEAGSAADKAGLVRGDVITKFDGQSVGSMSDLKDLMQYYEAGTTVELTIKKQAEGGYSEEKVEVTLGKRPSDMAQ
ncbi:MAG: PDZ domain-containing protein, partial [Lachnospiraceae bacterium]|nr:PDZ domain-containing protein [Lachnospiraceae bacterium]